jgi:hexulose-6-phosphate isomerase
MMLFGYPQHWIKILGPYIVRVHLKDFRRAAPSLAGFVDLLSGDVDFIAVFKALKSAGYDGWVTGEIAPYKQFPKQTIYNTAASMRTLLAGGE